MSPPESSFTGRPQNREADIPPGQYLTKYFPVLSTGPTPHVLPRNWNFRISSNSGENHEWSWNEFLTLPQEKVTTDIHCVTRWSKLGTAWRGVSLDTLFASINISADFAMVTSYGKYKTNVHVSDLLEGKAWIVHEFEGKPLQPEHGGPARLLVPHLYFWKSAKWVKEIQILDQNLPGFWESNGYHMNGDPWREERHS